MPKKFFFGFLVSLNTVLVVIAPNKKPHISGAPPYGEPEESVPVFGSIEWNKNWQRPEGPPSVALQVGHYQNDDLPDELSNLRTSDGAESGGKSEWEVNLAITEKAAEMLRKEKIEVDILPATIPPSFWADVFVAIHTDGSEDHGKRGFKVAAPWRDLTGNAQSLTSLLEQAYQKETGFEIDPNITRNMRGYYAFSWWRYEHALHPMTTAAILETGFLTNYHDRELLINKPEIPGKAITQGILDYLIEQKLIVKGGETNERE